MDIIYPTRTSSEDKLKRGMSGGPWENKVTGKLVGISSSATPEWAYAVSTLDWGDLKDGRKRCWSEATEESSPIVGCEPAIISGPIVTPGLLLLG